MHNKKECFLGKMVILHGKRNPGFGAHSGTGDHRIRNRGLQL